MHIQFKNKFSKNIKTYRDMRLEMGQQVFHIEKYEELERDNGTIKGTICSTLHHINCLNMY
jgi:hypothetical protein